MQSNFPAYLSFIYVYMYMYVYVCAYVYRRVGMKVASYIFSHKL